MVKARLDTSPLKEPNGKADGRVVKFENRPEFRRQIEIRAGHAIGKIGDGSPQNNYGIDGMKIRMLLHGPLATVQFLWSPGIYPIKERVPKRGYTTERWQTDDISGPTGWDLGYHADAPQYDEPEFPQRPMKCEYRPDGRCYYDGSSLAADRLMDLLMYDGEDAVWQELEHYYDSHNFKSSTVEFVIVPPKELEG